MRKWLDGLYELSAWVAGLLMIVILVMVVLNIVARWLHFEAPGADAYAGYATAGAGFMALASTLKHGEHIRVSLLIGKVQGRARRVWEVLVLTAAALLAGFLAFYSVHLAWQSWEIHDVSVAIDATPLWIPQLLMAAGTIVFFIAFCDELVLELLGMRAAQAVEDAHHE